MKKTKIICSIGPASDNADMIEKMVNAGMNVARINFSHATIESRQATVNAVKEVRKRTNQVIGILYDTKGPDFRTGELATEYIELIPGNHIIITKDNVLGTPEKITVNYKDAIDDIHVGNYILIDDGLMKLEVTQKSDDELLCKIINGGSLGSKKGINIPGVKLSRPFLSEQDIEDIIYACHHDGDFLAASFVETKEDILSLRELLQKEHRSDMLIISKVESNTAIQNIDDIIRYSDGVMIARGDLGVEVPMHDVPFLQKMIIRKCRQNGKFCIVATEMLASMYANARPTRAEATDIATAVLDGTDAVMLSGETTIGKYPLEAVTFMAEMLINSEKHDNYNKLVDKLEELTITESLAKSIVKTSFQINSKLIVVPTNGGTSARAISNLRPDCLTLALCKEEKNARRLALNFGVYAMIIPHYNLLDEMITEAREKAKEFMNLEKGDLIIIAGGHYISDNMPNFIKIEEI